MVAATAPRGQRRREAMMSSKANVSRRGLMKLAALSLATGTATLARAQGHQFDLRGVEKLARFGRRHHFVLVHGAWHGAWCWYKIAAALERCGQQVTAIDLPGGGIDATAPAAVTRQTQVERVIGVLDAAAEPVILVGHSAGGPVISEAAEARPEAIEKLVFLTAFLVPHGVSPVQISSGDTESLLTANLVLEPALGALDVRAEARRDVFYNECGDRDVALADVLLKPSPLQPLVPPMRLGVGFDSVRRFYITCLRDHAISPAVQESMYTALPCEEVLSLTTSDHSPFFSHPHALLRALRTVARA
jgi:pimeloyl-ACP methyl ester carboxylesterase